MIIDEGYIKYNCKLLLEQPLKSEIIEDLNDWRNKLYKLNLIGEYPNGIGFGNISIRGNIDKQFIISGTGTGGIERLNNSHYTTVIDYSWHENTVTCRGPVRASSETLTHAAIYESANEINAVIHVHHRQLWEKLMDKVPTTGENIAYGTPEMATEIIRLCREEKLRDSRIIVMKGHEEGIIAFGTCLEKAGNLLLEKFFSERGA